MFLKPATSSSNGASFFLLKVLVFFLPLFFCLGVSDHFGLGKQYFLWISVLALTLIWLWGKRNNLKGITYDSFTVAMMVFVFLVSLSGFLGYDGFASFWGVGRYFESSIFGLTASVVLAYLLAYFLKDDYQSRTLGILKIFLFSAFASTILTSVLLLGYLGASETSAAFRRLGSFNTLGAAVSIYSVFLVFGIIMFSWLKTFVNISKTSWEWWLKVIQPLFFIIALILLIFFDSKPAWFLLFLFSAISVIAIRYFGLSKKYLIVHISLAILSLSLFFFSPLLKFKPDWANKMPQEINIPYSQGWSMAGRIFANHPLLGSGTGTFVNNFSLYRDQAWNNGPLWQIRFDRNFSYFLELFGSTGLLGVASYLLIIGLFYYIAYFCSQQFSGREAKLWNFILILLFSFLFLAQLIIQADTVLLFMFWLFLGLAVAYWRHEKVLSVMELSWKNEKAELLAKLLIGSSFLASLIWLFFAGRYCLADYYYSRGGEDNLLKAINLNYHRDNYKTALAQLYLNNLRLEFIKPGDARNKDYILELAKKSLATARLAVAQSSFSVVNREVLAMVYRDAYFLIQDGPKKGQEAFAKASEVEPVNPVFHNEIGKIKMKDNDFYGAETEFKKSLELKADFYEAGLNLAVTYENNKETEKALKLLEDMGSKYGVAEFYYKQGEILYNHERLDEAEVKLVESLRRDRLHVNAMYTLGLIYEKRDDKTKALAFFRKVAEFNPSNIELKNKIEQLLGN